MSIRDVEAPAALRNREETQKAFLILKYAHDSASSFLEAFDTVREERGATVGATTDEEQDLLRAMVVMAAAGLDSMLKQLIRDALPTLATIDESVRDGLEKFVARQLRGDVDEPATATGQRFLARILIADAVQTQVIEEYVQHLTGSSLQSASEVLRTVTAFGLDPSQLALRATDLKPIFDMRNKIIHELDIDFDAARRNRANRTIQKMTDHANALLDASERILVAVDGALDDSQEAT